MLEETVVFAAITAASRSADAMTDPLTSLPQRAAVGGWLTDALRAAVATTRQAAVGLVDVDGFSEVIEMAGVDAADVVLQTLARRMQVATDHVGGRLARAGGDEFAVVLPAVSGELDAERLMAEVVDHAFGRPVTVADNAVYLTASTGVALSPPSDPQELMRRATVALARVKQTGGGRVAVYQPLPSATASNLARHSELHRAVEADELAAYYQPIVDVADVRVVGVEALVRWEHSTRGVLAPAEFLPAIADNPLIDDVGGVVLHQACVDSALLVTQVRDLSYVAVNVAPRQLRDRDFPDRVLTELDAAGLSPRRLVLELTGLASIDDLSVAGTVMTELREQGIRLAIDGYGTGSATLTALRQLPVDIVKIHRSFVAGLGRSEEDANIVASVASLAHSMGIETVADGVETEEQATAVRALGCRLAQGHWWSAAVPLTELPETIERINRDGHRQARRQRGLPGGPVEIRRIIEMHRSGASVQTIAAALNRAGLLTSTGSRWHAAQVLRVLDSAVDDETGSV
jgi:diguanylate cyclase (GGDEF)-like protein